MWWMTWRALSSRPLARDSREQLYRPYTNTSSYTSMGGHVYDRGGVHSPHLQGGVQSPPERQKDSVDEAGGVFRTCRPTDV